YQLEDAVGAVVVAFQPSAIFHNVNEGEYTIRVMDNNGCGAETTVTVDPPATIVFEVLPSTCMIGNNEGTIVVTVTSGNGNYQFTRDGINWFNPDPLGSNQYVFENLAPGSYTIQVRDGFGCPGIAAPVDIHP